MVFSCKFADPAHLDGPGKDLECQSERLDGIRSQGCQGCLPKRVFNNPFYPDFSGMTIESEMDRSDSPPEREPSLLPDTPQTCLRAPTSGLPKSNRRSRRGGGSYYRSSSWIGGRRARPCQHCLRGQWNDRHFEAARSTKSEEEDPNRTSSMTSAASTPPPPRSDSEERGAEGEDVVEGVRVKEASSSSDNNYHPNLIPGRKRGGFKGTLCRTANSNNEQSPPWP